MLPPLYYRYVHFGHFKSNISNSRFYIIVVNTKLTKKLKTALIRVESNFLTGSGHEDVSSHGDDFSKFNLYVASRELSKNLISAFELKGAKYIPLKDISQDNELMHLVAQISRLIFYN